jgi:NAD(P)-dependent dehydrogenase (short-subunit alcohol dehydrogenase family)
MESLMQINCRDQRVMITGAASGMGAVTARAFVAAGARVWICDRDPLAVERFRAENPSIGCCVTDVTDEDQIQRFFDEAQRELGGLDTFINNAGYSGPACPIEDIPVDEIDRLLAINVRAQFICLRHAVPLLKTAGGGAIINFSSAAGRMGYPLRSGYAASKWAVIGLTQSLAMELGRFNIRVNAMLPGSVAGYRMKMVIATRAKATGRSESELERQEASAMSLGRLIPPEHIANMVVFACSLAGAYISGQSLGVDGNLETLRD